MPLWLLIKPFWKPILGAVVILFLALYVRHAWNEHGEQQYKFGVADTKEQWKAQSLKEAQEAREAVAAAQSEAQAEREKAITERKASEEKERERQQESERTRARLMHDLESRYRKALVEDQSCAAWSRQPVSCPFN